MIGPFTRIAELRHLVDEVAEVDWSDRAWWALMAAAAAAETLADLRAPRSGVHLVHDDSPAADTLMAWPALPPRSLAEAIADAIVGAAAAVRAIADIDGSLPDQPLRVTVELGRAGADLQPADPARVRFAVAGRWLDARLTGEPQQSLGLARELARLAVGPRYREDHTHALPAAIAVVIGSHDLAAARHLHRHTWNDAGGPWFGLGRAGPLAVASTCHRVVDGHGHRLIAGRVASAPPAHAGLHAELVRAAAEVVGEAPVPPLPPPPGATPPLGIAWSRIGGSLPRFAQLAHGLGHVLWDELGDRRAPVSPVIQVPVAPGRPDDPERWRRRVIYTLLSVRFRDGHPEPVAAFSERAAAAIAREIDGRGLLSRLLDATAAAPLPVATKRRGITTARPGRFAGPIDVLAGWSSLSLLPAAPEGELAPSLVAVSSPARLLQPGDARSTSTITVVGDADGATVTVAGTGRAATPAGAQELLDALLARSLRPD